MRLWLLLLTAVLYLTGCGRTDYIYIPPESSFHRLKRVFILEVDESLTYRDKLSIRSAVSKWNYALNGNIEIQIGETRPHKVIQSLPQKLDTWYIERTHSAHVVWKDMPSEDAIAFVNAVGGYRISLIRDLLSDDEIEASTMHEIGHLLGADHTRAFLMDPAINSTCRCVDVLTMIKVSQAQNIPIEMMRYCVYP